MFSPLFQPPVSLPVKLSLSVSTSSQRLQQHPCKKPQTPLHIRYDRHVSPTISSVLTSDPAALPNSGAGSKVERLASVRYPNLQILSRTWDPTEGIAVITCGVIIIPGFQWHSGWFGHLATALTKRASARVVALDLLSTGDSDDIDGVRGHTPDMRDHIDDLSTAVQRLSSDIENKPVYVLGESSGGITACLLALRDEGVNKIVKGWILCAPALQIFDKWLPPRPVVYASRYIASILPLLPSPRRVEKETMEAGVGETEIRDLAMKDPLVLYDVPFPLATMRARLNAMDEVDDAVENGKLNMNKVLVIHNRDDPCAIFEASSQFVKMVNTGDDGEARLVDPGGQAHQLLQEREDITKIVIDHVVSFVNDTGSEWKP